MSNQDRFVPQGKPIGVIGGNDAFNARVMPGGATPIPITPAARIGGGAQGGNFVPVKGTREVQLAGSNAPATLQGIGQSVLPQAPVAVQPAAPAVAPQGGRFQSVSPPLPQRQPVNPQVAPAPAVLAAPPAPAAPAPAMGRAPYLQQPQGEAVFRVTLSGRTADGQPWDSVHDAAFPAGVQLDGPPAIQQVQ